MAGTKHNAFKAAFCDENEKAWLALSLAWIAGFADAFAFLALMEIFCSAVSGNTVAVGASLAKRDWREAARHGCPIVFYTGGLVIGMIIEKITCWLKIRRRFGIALAIETVLLLAFMLLGQSFVASNQSFASGSARFFLLVALLAGAMGIQTASLRRVRQHSVQTTFVTGMLVKAVEYSMNAIFNASDRLKNRNPEFPNDSSSKAVFHGALWFCFAIGAICGGFGEISWRFSALFAPIGLLAFIIVCDIFRPVCD